MTKNLIRVPALIKTFSLVGKVKLPERFKGTFIEKWSNYWKNLFIDYRQMLQDLRTDIQDNPRKAMIYTAGIGTLAALYNNNPNEIDFKDELKRIHNEVIMVSDECLNEQCIEHLRFLNTCYNQGVIHYKNLGIASIMYTSELSDACNLYKSQCSYVQPVLSSFPSRIVDVGIMGKWWNLYKKTTNYDVNF